MSLTKTELELDNIISFLVASLAGDDKGLRLVNGGQFAIGSRTEPAELVVGEGDSTIDGMIVKTSPDEAVFTNFTAEAGSDSGSTYAAFNGTAVGNAMYIGSDFPISGMKLKVDTVAVPGTGVIAREYWNGATWETFKAMAVNADDLTDVRADDIGTTVGSEQVRFDNSMAQVKKVIDGDDKYWVRFRITSAITTDGLNEQIKLHTNRWECNGNGETEYFGAGVYVREIRSGIASLTNSAGSTPASQDIPISANITVKGEDNKFSDNLSMGKTDIITMPEGLDTSRPLKFEIDVIADTANVGNVEINWLASQVLEGSIVGALAEQSEDTITAFNNELNVVKTISAELNVENLKPGDQVAIQFIRDAGAGNPGDTLSGAILLLNYRVIARFWRP